MPRRFPRFLLSLALVLVSLLLCAGLLELGLRLFVHDASPERFTTRWHFVPHPERGYDLAARIPPTPHRIEGDYIQTLFSNELGCMDRPPGNETDAVLLLGDSFTHCWAPFEEKWGTWLETWLGRRVHKCGVIGYGTRQQLGKARDLLDAMPPPRLVLAAWFLNDLVDDYTFPQRTVVDGCLADVSQLTDHATGAREVKDNASIERTVRQGLAAADNATLSWRDLVLVQKLTQLHTLLTGRAGHVIDLALHPRAAYPWLDQAWKDHLANILALRDLAASRGAAFALVIIPSKEQVYPWLLPPGSPADLEQPGRVFQSFCADNAIPCLDLLPVFRAKADQTPRRWLDPETDLYWRHDGHWNLKGNRLAGLAVARFLLSAGLVPPANATLPALEDRIAAFR